MIELLEHNVETYHKLCEEMEKHNKVALIQATGTGKSYIISKYIEEHHLNALILVPTNAIGEQWAKLLPDTEIKTYQAMVKGIDGDYDLIVADEMHHLGSEVWGKSFIDIFMKNDETRVIGLTATEIRYLDNGRDMAEEIFDGIAVRGANLAEAISSGVLPTFKYIVSVFGNEEMFNEYREKAQKITDKTVAKELSTRLEMCIQNQKSIKEAMLENLSGGPHKIIVFLNGICEIEQAIEMFSGIFPFCSCYHVSTKESKKHNKQAITNYQNAKADISILFAVDMLNEGVHIDGTDCVVMFRNTVSPQIYFQQLGRVLSTSRKYEPIIFDFACNNSNIIASANVNDSANNIIYEINKGISNKSNKSKKIIVKSYVKDICRVFEEIEKRLYTGFQKGEDDFIKSNFYNMKVKEIAKHLNRPASSVGRRCRELGLSKKRIGAKQKHISKDEIVAIENVKNKTIKEIADELCVDECNVRYAIKKYDLKHKVITVQVKTPLSPEEKEFILSQCKEKNYREIAKEITRGNTVVYNFLKKNGIIQNPKKRSVMQKDARTGKIIAVYESVAVAARSLGVKASSISCAASGRAKTAYGYKWQYANE